MRLMFFVYSALAILVGAYLLFHCITDAPKHEQSAATRQEDLRIAAAVILAQVKDIHSPEKESFLLRDGRYCAVLAETIILCEWRKEDVASK